MKLQLELYNETYTIESAQNDYSANELMEKFSRLLVAASFPPSVIQLAGGGKYECDYKEEE